MIIGVKIADILQLGDLIEHIRETPLLSLEQEPELGGRPAIALENPVPLVVEQQKDEGDAPDEQDHVSDILKGVALGEFGEDELDIGGVREQEEHRDREDEGRQEEAEDEGLV